MKNHIDQDDNNNDHKEDDCDDDEEDWEECPAVVSLKDNDDGDFHAVVNDMISDETTRSGIRAAGGEVLQPGDHIYMWCTLYQHHGIVLASISPQDNDNDNNDDDDKHLEQALSHLWPSLRNDLSRDNDTNLIDQSSFPFHQEEENDHDGEEEKQNNDQDEPCALSSNQQLPALLRRHDKRKRKGQMTPRSGLLIADFTNATLAEEGGGGNASSWLPASTSLAIGSQAVSARVNGGFRIIWEPCDSDSNEKDGHDPSSNPTPNQTKKWHKVKYEAAPWECWTWRPGTCSAATPSPPSTILKRVQFLYEHDRAGPSLSFSSNNSNNNNRNNNASLPSSATAATTTTITTTDPTITTTANSDSIRRYHSDPSDHHHDNNNATANIEDCSNPRRFESRRYSDLETTATSTPGSCSSSFSRSNSVIPDYNVLWSNCETVAVWCVTGHWETLQGSRALQLTQWGTSALHHGGNGMLPPGITLLASVVVQSLSQQAQHQRQRIHTFLQTEYQSWMSSQQQQQKQELKNVLEHKNRNHPTTKKCIITITTDITCE